MIITIDTAKDSKEEIKRVVEFLNQLHDLETQQTNAPTESYGEGMFGLFNDNNNNPPEEKPEETLRIIKY